MSGNNINNADGAAKREYSKDDAYKLAERIYDLDSRVYEAVGSDLGRTFIGDRDKRIGKLTSTILSNPHGYNLRSEIALVGNMARTIRDKAQRRQCMLEYNSILKAIADIPRSFGTVDILDETVGMLNLSNLREKNYNKHLIICISRTEGSAGTDIGFALADELRINYYDAEVFKDVISRQDAEKDARWKSTKKALSFQLLSNTKVREFSRNHGLPKADAEFFNESKLLCELAQREDFIVIGRCADVILKNNNIPHISVFITAPIEQRARRIMELEQISFKQACKRLVKQDAKRERHYRYYTGRIWGNATNYDLCINSVSYGIEEAVNLILRIINREAVENHN